MPRLRDLTSALGRAFGPQAAASAVFVCARCRQTAATVALLPPDHPHSLSQSYTVAIRDFIGQERVVVSRSGAAAMAAVLHGADAAALYHLDQLWAPFYCPQCARSYCVQHWTVVPDYDEGYFDCSYGYCPEGHRRLIEE